MPKDTDPNAGPNHVAIIMDGNGRWAQQRKRPRLVGHHAGAKRVKEIVRACPNVGVKYLTIFAFSTENWKRTQAEVSGLMKLFRRYIEREAQDLLSEGVRVRFIGDRMKLDDKLVTLMDNLELLTANNSKVHLTIALNYGGRDEVTRAAQLLAHEVAQGNLCYKDVDAETLSSFLDTRFLPDPDLVRTFCCGNRPMRNTNLSKPCGLISPAKSFRPLWAIFPIVTAALVRCPSKWPTPPSGMT